MLKSCAFYQKAISELIANLTPKKTNKENHFLNVQIATCNHTFNSETLSIILYNNLASPGVDPGFFLGEGGSISEKKILCACSLYFCVK